jgi:hypothetical protein
MKLLIFRMMWRRRRKEVIYHAYDEQIEPATEDALSEIIIIFKNNKLRGEEYISAELTKQGDKKLWEKIQAVIEVVYTKEKTSENWRTAIICPVHNKGHIVQCSNCR